MTLQGFIANAPPKSVSETVSRVSHDRLKSIAKNAMENYLRRFLDTTGEQHATIGSIAKGALTFITDRSIDATQDVTRRTTQLVRLFNDVRERVPSIVIIDGGMESIPSGLNSGLVASTSQNGKWQGWFNKQFRIPLTLAIVTHDQDSTDQLMEVVELCLNNLRQIAGGSLLRSDNLQDAWEVRLPLNFDISGTAGENVTDDPKDQLWIATFNVTVDAEDTFGIELPLSVDFEQGVGDSLAQGASPNQPDLSAALPPLIESPDEMPIGSSHQVRFLRLRDDHRVVIVEPMMATIDLATSLVTPRRLGTFTLQVMDISTRQNDQPRANTPVVAAQKIVTVTL